MIKTISASIIIVCLMWFLTPNYIEVVFDFLVELFNQWFWFI